MENLVHELLVTPFWTYVLILAKFYGASLLVLLPIMFLVAALNS